MELWQWLSEAGAARDVVDWARPFRADWDRAWQECPRGDWLLAIAAKRGADPRTIVSAAAACARLALAQVPDDELAPLDAIDTAERWARGEEADVARARARIEHLVDAAPDPAVAAAATAALAALSAIDSPGDAATAAAAVVQAAVLDAGDCAMLSAMGYAQSECARVVREHVALPV